ncbi:FAD linked oxidase-like protein [Nitrosococcus oceani ATCC 19707]|uniref:FAD linked oxidase-like protein n=2 Tax=Nitrosococcus oceani TaxID=1229 RepID=Q3J9T3_NITOC|nr:FAD-binding protein [Nitrosococcus oceani]ABA58413.1 FAD linked oxidase-like protein [Nitrosococcus oceani ATCC 19707]EDZ68460.1 FAD binding domain protein [Nitrosococcus oceani AFC27]KFI19127.1 FAD-linked oxidase [Nitrosococcus oceani C-27]GEM18807.1 FAD-linked oxidase [Nitrosococcus oceani]
MAASLSKTISGWGRYPVAESILIRPEKMPQACVLGEEHLICRGQGRSYGDAAISSQGRVILTERLNRFLAFDNATGVLTAEAGVTLAEILETFVPRGWFPPVTPGTQYVSLGGTVAADVHGKNHHHKEAFAAHVIELELILADGRRQRCSPNQNEALFWATVGGMGLTGIITEVSFRLMPIETAAIMARNYTVPDLETIFKWLEDTEHDDQYSVAWLDCAGRSRHLGRGILITGHHAVRDELPGDWEEPLCSHPKRQKSVPFNLPPFILNRVTIAAFNEFYYHRQGSKKAPFLTDYSAFFYPLDTLAHWNRLYGKRGFLQYQAAIPEPHAYEGIRCLLEYLARNRQASFLAVLKRLGPGNIAPLSFPLAGYTLALDLPMGGEKVLNLLQQLDEIVIDYGGRVYLAKDARLSPESLRAMYPRLGEWQQVKQVIDPEERFQSDLSRRLQLTGAP